MAGSRWVGVGYQVAEVLRRAYATAVGRGSPAGTLDVLAQAVRLPAMPVRFSAERRQELERVAMGSNHLRPWYGPGEVDVVAEPDSEVDPLLREIEWLVRRTAGRLGRVSVAQVEPWSARPRWTPATRVLLGNTLAEAWVRGVTFAGLSHLLLAMQRLRDCDGARQLARTGVRHSTGLTRLVALDEESAPYPDAFMVDLEPAAKRRGPVAWFARFMIGQSPIDMPLGEARADIKAQAVRLDHGVAGAGHALLALLRADECLGAKRVRLPPRVRARGRGADLLRAAGMNPYRLAAKLSALPPLPDPDPGSLAAQLRWLRRGDPFLSDELVRAEERAGEISREHGHTGTGTTHFLLALLEAPSTGPLLAACRVDGAALRTRTKAELGRLSGART
ncbi:Clp amino terminal domain-containing protein, pathogenicity island component [Asanoa hainanensis]|uniref:Clp amino terminal domain-containing protein, pathogenicity island component n=1 Tax=Asanoa hainanensis TaxID=560556 RepID=A0A239NE94_9ACTN|nr:Clp protease N-terminal domain-containing protein [Asanoa hainanensis]SNT53287.1 Clp amino terminal domain-containing protein, pathogenicity island component [Asanoa hainanensis]